MAEIIGKPKVELKVNFQISEEEARALDALAGYGVDEFIKHFYEFLGEAYLKKHEVGLRVFLKSVRTMIPPWIQKVEDARKSFEG